MTSRPRALPWYVPGGADLVFLVLSVLIIPSARQGMLDDPGLGWHLRNIDAMRAQGGWLGDNAGPMRVVAPHHVDTKACARINRTHRRRINNHAEGGRRRAEAVNRFIARHARGG